jgi:hypothetical protein
MSSVLNLQTAGGAATPSLAALSTASFSHCGKKGISSFSGSYCGNYAVFA